MKFLAQFLFWQESTVFGLYFCVMKWFVERILKKENMEEYGGKELRGGLISHLYKFILVFYTSLHVIIHFLTDNLCLLPNKAFNI